TAARTAAAMPLGAQQLRRQRTSTLLSLAGVTASLLVVFAQLGIERAVYDSGVRVHHAVVGARELVPPGLKSLQLHAGSAPARLVCNRPRAPGDRRARPQGEPLQAARIAARPVRPRFAALL